MVGSPARWGDFFYLFWFRYLNYEQCLFWVFLSSRLSTNLIFLNLHFTVL